MKIKTANTIIYCQKWQETVQFYRDGLGLKITEALDWFVEFEINAQARLSIANQDRASIKSSHGQGITLTLQVEQIEHIHQQFQQKKLIPTEIKNRWGARVFYLNDPEGSRLEFWQN